MESHFVGETYHSTIWRHHNEDAVTKCFRRKSDPRTLTRWREEVRTLTHIGFHPNITEFLSASKPDLSITMTLASGRVLSSYDPVTLAPHVHTICLQLSCALAHIHALDFVHDDVKPDNIIFFVTGGSDSVATTTLIDFGACIERGEFTESGTPWYMAPEFVHRMKGPQTDVWAMGITMVWVLGEFLLPDTTREQSEWILPMIWQDEEERRKMDAWLAEVDGVRGRLSTMTEGLETLISQMLISGPERKIGSAEIVKALGSFLETDEQ